MATIYDVAKDVGLSHTAVSAVLNNKPARVSKENRQRIVEAAGRLGYRTNRAAQQLATGKFDTVAVCFEQPWDGLFMHPIVNQLTAGIGFSASENGLYLLFPPSEPEDKFESIINHLPMHGVDGAIIVGALPFNVVPAIDRCMIPLVCIDSHPGFASASTVDQDNRTGMRMGVEHLITNGHQRLAYLGDEWNCQCLADRLAGFHDAVQSAKLPPAEQATHIVRITEVPGIVRRLVEAPDGPTAIVSGEEFITQAIMDEVTRLGLRVPEDLAILAYGDPPAVHPLTESINIIRNVPYEVGKTAGHLLKKTIDGEHQEPVNVRLEPELVLRPCPNNR